MIPIEWLYDAIERIMDHVIQTPFTYDEKLNIFLKWENKQVTGSFKIRGALNKVMSLEKWELDQGLVTASAGNHGKGVALSGKIVGASVKIFASDHAVPVKIDAMKKLGAEVFLVDGSYEVAEQAALEYANHKNATYVSPYNDGQVIAGQGTIAMEVIDLLPGDKELTWVSPVGGGGLISGIGTVIRHFNKPHRLIGIQPEASPFTFSLFHNGTQSNIIDLPTLADGLSGPMQSGSITLPMIKNLVDNIQTVTESEIEYAIAYAWHNYDEIIEGSSATALAAVLANKIQPPAILIMSGGNIQPEVHDQICRKYAATV